MHGKIHGRTNFETSVRNPSTSWKTYWHPSPSTIAHAFFFQKVRIRFGTWVMLRPSKDCDKPQLPTKRAEATRNRGGAGNYGRLIWMESGQLTTLCLKPFIVGSRNGSNQPHSLDAVVSMPVQRTAANQQEVWGLLKRRARRYVFRGARLQGGIVYTDRPAGRAPH